MVKTIEGLERGCKSFISLFEDIRIHARGRSIDLQKLLEDYYEEQYEHIKKMMEDADD